MRVMVLIKATKNSEAGVMPPQELFDEMTAFNEELVKAGVMLAGDGLKPSAHAKRVHFRGDAVAVVDGPFAETRELIAGYWLWNVASLDEAVAWMKKCPHPMPGEDAEVELRPLYEAEDFGAALTPEVREREDRMRAELERRR
jgi:hypothetical protein